MWTPIVPVRPFYLGIQRQHKNGCTRVGQRDGMRRVEEAADIDLGIARGRLWWVADAVGGEDVWGTAASAIRDRLLESLDHRAQEVTELIAAVAGLEERP